MYVTLVPCHHHGKTPPCTQAIIKSGIQKVVLVMKTPIRWLTLSNQLRNLNMWASFVNICLTTILRPFMSLTAIGAQQSLSDREIGA